MSKASRARSKLKRLLEKRKRKAANKALYEARRKAGENSKSKRFRKNAKKKNVAFKGMHILHPNCGNIGCKKCNPDMRKVA